ncbi:AAA family ATPase [Levilactobacillus sp. HBUAS70063]|uniref:AAA family ATPase n=1 Tax=Levilactobacillus sp. HBUAS70063 TaxID=3109359 RepID=UPI0031332DBC
MRIQNLGPIKDATVTLNKLTVFIGNNGMGKTLAAYAVFAFRNWLETSFQPNLFTLDDLHKLIAQGNSETPTVAYRQKLVQKTITEFNALNTEGTYFQSFFKAEGLYRPGVTKIEIAASDLLQDTTISGTLWGYTDRDKFTQGQGGFYRFRAELDRAQGKLRLSNKEEAVDEATSSVTAMSLDAVAKQLDRVIANLFVGNLDQSVYLPAERIGINVFRTRINSQLINENLANPAERQSSPERYPYPIEAYIRFLNSSLGLLTQDYSVSAAGKQVLSKLIPGKFSYDEEQDQLQYQLADGQATKRIKFSLVSSSLKSLFGIDLFLRRRRMGYLLLDEPEMNLHPERQKLVADLLFDMAIQSTPVVVSTHSDYFIKELVNQVLQSKVDDPHHRGRAQQVSVYEFTAAGVKELGDISEREEFENFDRTTNQINQRYYQLLDRLEDDGGSADE